MSKFTLIPKDFSALDKNIKIVFVTAEFNHNFTSQLEEINKKYLQEQGFENIDSYLVPGAFEIPGFVNKLLKHEVVDLVIAL